MKVKRQRYPADVIAAVLAEKAKHRHSEEAWAAYIATVKSGPTLDILVYDTGVPPGDEDSLIGMWMAPVSDDVGEAIAHALADCADDVTVSEDGNGPTEVTIASPSWSGSASVEHEFDDDDNYAMTERASDYDEYSSIRARAICLAILDMYSPSEEELNAGQQLA